MDDKRESKSPFTLPVLLIVSVFMAGGIFKYYAPMDSMRPLHNGRSVELQLGEEKVLSRMWQDPLQAVDNYMSNFNKDDKITMDFRSQLDSKEKPLLILPIFISAGNYAEEAESRLRSRYALLSALHVAGYRSNNASHIGVFNLKEFMRQYLNKEPKDYCLPYKKDLYIPFEWFVPDHFKATKSGGIVKSKYKSILILWLNEEPFIEKTISKFQYLREYLSKMFDNHKTDKIHFKIIGPSDSTFLEKMLSDVEKNNDKPNNENKKIEMYSPWSTAEPFFMSNNDFRKGKLRNIQEIVKIMNDPSLIVIGNITDWEALLLEIKEGSNSLANKLLTSKLKETNQLEKFKTINVSQLTDDMKEDIVAIFNAFKDNLTFYKDKIAVNSYQLSPEEKKKLDNLNEILEEPEVFKKNIHDLSISQIGNIKWFNIAILEKLFPKILSKSQKNNNGVPVTPVDMLSAAGITLKRAIHTDLHLTDELVKELDRRGVELSNNGSDHIVLISEWDSFYGRALPLSFAVSIEKYRMEFSEKNTKHDNISFFPDRIHKLTYMHGIDGMLPSEEVESNRTVTKKTVKNLQKKNSSFDKGYYAPEFKQPLGMAQYDYIRRLAEKIKQLPYNNPDGRSSNMLNFSTKIRAIGVLGSDIYDKLLILRALRPEYPNTIFFTNDLDARLFHDTELKWTRNLIVASSYGLQLHPGLQRDIPPFRNNYQSSLFAASLQALGVKVDIDLEKIFPRIFEIGRKGPYDITPIQKNDKTDTLYPMRNDRWQSNIKTQEFWLYISLMLVFPLLFFTFLIYRRTYAIKKEYEELTFRLKITNKQLWIFLFGIPCLVSFVALTYFAFLDSWCGDGEPLTFFDSISIWPTVLIRLFCGFLTIYFIILSIQNLIHNRITIDDYFKNSDKGTIKRHSFNISSLWGDYGKEEGSMKKCLSFAGIFAFVYLGTVIVTLNILGWPPVPFRGDLCHYTNIFILGFSLLSMGFLAWFVFNRVYYCHKFFSHIDVSHPSEVSWCGQDITCSIGKVINKEKCGKKDLKCQEIVNDCLVRYDNYLSGKISEEWSKIWIIAERTEVIGKMIMYSFTVFALLLISRNQFFDCWTWPKPLIVVISVTICVGIYNSFILFNTANTIRRKTITHLYKMRLELMNIQIPTIHKMVCDKQKESKKESKVNRTKREDEIKELKVEQRLIDGDKSNLVEQRTKYLECIIKDIQDLKHGAFTPLGRNPLLIAILTPLGGMGSVAILPYLMQMFGN